jgi:hypothetical protein
MLRKRTALSLAHVAAGLLVAACDPGPDSLVAPDPGRAARPVVQNALGPASDAVTRWNAVAGTAAIAGCLAPTNNPIYEARLFAIMHVAVHDALNTIERRARPYALNARLVPNASADAAVAAAAHDVLVAVLGRTPPPFDGCIGAGVAEVEAAYAAALQTIPNGAARTLGLGVGRAAAATILALRADDGSDTPFIVTDYPQGTAPGEYRFTPGFDFIALPGWADVMPFVLKRAEQFRPPPPYALASRKYAADYNEVKALGGDGITTPSARTADQTEAALFWIENSPLMWNRIARTVSAAQGLDLWENARLFGLLNLALADGYLGTFEAKRHYSFWRPVTAIREGNTDRNPATVGDPAWTPLVPTPPIPDHDSGHAVEGGAAAEVLAQFFGTNWIGFSACSYTLPAGSQCGDEAPELRSYGSFSQAAEENAYSRILVGFHFRKAVEDGTTHGRKIGRFVVNHARRPLHGGKLAALP